MNVERGLARMAADAALLLDPDWWFQHAPLKAEEHPGEFVEFVLRERSREA